jgi:hypothetical protein
MAKIELIEFDNYPIWEQQSSESEDNFLRFNQWFLPQIKPNLLAAYRAYCQANGDGKRQNKLTLKDAPQSWRVSCERDRWRERHRAYYRQQTFDNLEYLNEKRLELIESELRLSQLLMARAADLLTMKISENDRMKDAPMLARAASELSRKALNLDGLDGHVAAVIRAGFEVIDPTLLVLESNQSLGEQND